MDNKDPYELEPRAPQWRCQECGHVGTKKPMPKDRSKYYSDPRPAKCPKCTSEAMMPEGF